MTNLLLRLFIKDYQKTDKISVRAAYGTLAGAVGIVTNILVATAKLVIGVLASSVSVMADATNNLSDAGTSLVTMVGFKLSGKPADREHPYGHARIEYITGLIVSLLIVMLGVFLLIESVEKIINKSESSFSIAAIIVLVISIAAKLWQGLFYSGLAKKINSVSLSASAQDSKNDVIATSLVLVGAIVGKFTSLEIDGYIGILVSLFIIISGIRLIIETSSPLLGAPPEKETVNRLTEKILSYDGIVGIHDLIIHSYGANRIFCSVHAEVPADRDIMLSHDIIDNVEEDVKKELGIDLVIHLDPITVGNERVDEIKNKVEEILVSVSPKIKYHDFRVVFGVTHNNILFDILIPMEFELSEEELIERVSQEIKNFYPNAVPKIKIDRDFNDMLD